MKSMDFADNKLSILYFVDTLHIPLTNTQITEFFVQKVFINYFDLQLLLSELVTSGHLGTMECRNHHYYSVTDKGKEALRFFLDRIDSHTREVIKKYAEEHRARLKRESQLTSEYKRLENNEFEVLLRVMEENTILLELKLNVITLDQAKSICALWQKKAPEVYKKIMESLM